MEDFNYSISEIEMSDKAKDSIRKSISGLNANQRVEFIYSILIDNCGDLALEDLEKSLEEARLYVL